MMNHILSFQDFLNALYRSGFSMGGGNSEGIYAIIPWGWNETPPYETPVRWHTENPDTDPWEWRMRVLNECDDIAYSKLFFNKSGYITKEWYPYFLAARRGGKGFYEAYEDGKISHDAKRIYEVVAKSGAIPLHIIKIECGFGKEAKAKFDKAITELQMKMYITMCDNARKLSAKGEEYGWSSTMFCTVEQFWGQDVINKAYKIKRGEAVERITEQINVLNPNADAKKAKNL